MGNLCRVTAVGATVLLAGVWSAAASPATWSLTTASAQGGASPGDSSPRGSSKVAPNIGAQLGSHREVEVFVLLHEPALSRPHDLRARRRAIRALRRSVLSSVRPEEVRVQERLSIVSGFSASVTASGLSKLLAHPVVRRIDPMQFGSDAAQGVSQIRADAVHHRDDLGQDVTVAVLDTGVDTTHPDLAGSIVGEHCFCSSNCCPDGSSDQSGPGSALATFDDPRCKLLPPQTCSFHGTHVTGIIVSKGIIAPVGVAPLAKVVAVKVLDDQGRGSLLDWIKALSWIAETRTDVQAINMSMESDDLFAGDCDAANAFTAAFAQVLGVLRARGTLTFAAAGNGKGGTPGNTAAMAAPACVSAAVAVGAVSENDLVAAFGNSDAALDLLAPGVAIVSTGPDHSTAVLSGTSMATPHATGTAALLLAINPDLGADQVESLLRGSGTSVLDLRNALTFRRLNALAAMNVLLSVTSPLTGTGSHRTDCLVEWKITPTNIARWRPIPGAVCRDDDPSCDADQIHGQCTFRPSICFEVPDRRLPACDAGAPIIGYRKTMPSASPPGDATDAANAAAIDAALPELPIDQPDTCTASIPFVVPAGGSKWIRFSAHAADGRTDYDRLRFTCLPAE